ncbi:Aste57867_3657 [Aphanomyces stellatus]|uniref:Peroxisomal ATPase PEX6 n=1 Tax=Aphanomyces stellatus TaxID=120398 RepID=A0A485KAZ2_9STRA|nr:hypothetical protein As57867_003646 [Aphanomyces stellatus]VFT80812.1 Aste57867_3657 [Aphanomyces stellatus]
MSALWCSSFTRTASGVFTTASSGSFDDSDVLPSLKLRVYMLDQVEVEPSVTSRRPPREVNALVALSASNMRRLGVISLSYVLVRFQDSIHVAQVQFQSYVADDVVFMSPFLAQNLDCNELSDVVVEPVSVRDLWVEDPAISISYPRLHAPPTMATRVEIAPLLWNSTSAHQELVLQSLRVYFTTPRLFQIGDVFGVPWTETFPGKTPHDAPPPIVVHVDVCFFRVHAMESSTASINNQHVPRALLVATDETTLVQTAPVAMRLVHERLLRQFSLAAAPDLPPAAVSFPLRLHHTHLQNLVEWLHPTSVPVSIALGGVAGSGKKTLLYNAAQHLGLYVLEASFTELASSSELQLLENVRHLVQKAQSLAPCILFLNRFFLTEKDNEEAELRLGATLMECMHQEMQVPLVVAVEDINELPVLIRQSFMYEIVLEAPSEDERLDLLEQLTRTVALHPDVHLQSIAHRTAGRTAGELKALIADASSHCLADLCSRDDFSPEAAMAYQLRTQDLDAAIREQETKSSLGLGSFSIPNVKWEDVGGLENVKDEILDMVQLPFKHPELFAAGVRQRSGILLYGPPGTGKTLLAKAIATECNMNFISVKGPELLNMYIGESEKNVRQVFQMARNAKPCILFFDELDSLAPQRGRGSDSGGGVMDRVVSQLLTEIDGNLHQVFVVGATNRPDLIESALLRPGRFDRLLYLGICQDKATQLKVVQALTRKFQLAPAVDLKQVVALCPLNFTGADFYALCSMALSLAIKDRVAALDLYIGATYQEANRDDVYSERPLHAAMVLEKMTPEELQVQVAQDHFAAALAHVVPSVSASELAHYEKLRQQFSSLPTK